MSLSCNGTPVTSPIDLILASAEHSAFVAIPVISKQSHLRYWEICSTSEEAL